MKKLLILTYASQSYYKLVIPFIFFALTSNSDAVIEVIVKNITDFKEKNRDSLKILSKIYKNLFYISENKYNNVLKIQLDLFKLHI